MNVNRKELLAALKQAARVAPKKSPRTGGTCVLLESTGGTGLDIKATDLEAYFWTNIDGEGKSMRVLVNAVAIRDLIKGWPGGDEIELSNVGLDLKIGTVTVRGEDPDLFPSMPEATEAGQGFTMNGPDFKRMISEVAFAAARDESRYAINGIMIERKGDKLRLVATDGRRLSLSEHQVAGGEDFQAVVPSKPLGYVRMALGKLDVPIVHVGTNFVWFTWDRSLMVIRQLESRFPEYSAVIPKSAPIKVNIDRKELIAALLSLKPFTSNDISVVNFNLLDLQLLLSAKSDQGEGSVTLDVDSDSEGKTALNPEYLLEALKASDLPAVQLQFEDNRSPVLWNLGFTYVQMPISGA